MIGRLPQIVHALRRLFAPRTPPAFAQTAEGETFFGWVDGVRHGRLVGWACGAEPTKRLNVRFETRNRSLVSRADIYRADAQRSGYSASGYCGFSVPVKRLGDGPVRVFVEYPRIELGGSPAIPDMPAPAPALIDSDDGIVLSIDSAQTRLSGWICDRNAPSRRPLLDLQFGGVTIEQRRATQYRPDASRAVEDGWRGFDFSLPPGPGDYSIQDAETKRVLHAFRREAR